MSERVGPRLKTETIGALVMVGWVLFAIAAFFTIIPLGFAITPVLLVFGVWVGSRSLSRVRTLMSFGLALVVAVLITLFAVATVVDHSDFVLLGITMAALTNAVALGSALLLWRSFTGAS